MKIIHLLDTLCKLFVMQALGIIVSRILSSLENVCIQGSKKLLCGIRVWLKQKRY